jgi:hypothetical protein
MRQRLRNTLITGIAAAFGLVAVALGAAGGGGVPSNQLVYELAIFRDGTGGSRLRTEWISPATGEWRFEEDGRVKIYSRGRYAVIDPITGASVRSGSARIMGYLAIGAVALEPLKLYISGKREGSVSERTREVRITISSSGAMALRFRRDGVPLRGVVTNTMRTDEAEALGLFDVPLDQAISTTTERPLGSRPTLPVRAYWLGREFAGRRATTTMEFARDVPAAMARVGANADRLSARAYVTMYELPSAGLASSAVPGRLPPQGEIMIVSQPLSLALSQANVRAMNGVNGEHEYAPWPREVVTLVNGERATIVPNLADGVQTVRSGEEQVWQFAVITEQTLTWVSGGFDLRSIGEVAAQLRPVSG